MIDISESHGHSFVWSVVLEHGKSDFLLEMKGSYDWLVDVALLWRCVRGCVPFACLLNGGYNMER